MAEVERLRLLTKARAAGDRAHRVASSLLLAHLLTKAEKVENNEEERKEEKGLSRRMTAFILHEKTPYVKVHGREKGMVRQPRQQRKVGPAEEGMQMEGLSGPMAAFVSNEKTPYVKVHGGEKRTPRKHHKEGQEIGKVGEEEKETKTDKRRAVLAYVLGERMPGIEGRVLNEELFVELVGLMTPPWAEI